MTQKTEFPLLYRCVIALRGMVFGAAFCIVVPAHAATIKPVSMVNDDVVRLGDIFSDLPAHADAVLGRSPQPGTDMVLNARTLARIATTHNLNWSPQSLADQVTIKRDTRTVTSIDIQNAVKAALDRRGVEGSYQINLADLNAAMIIPSNLPATAEVTNLTYTQGRDVFMATIAAPSASNPYKTINVSGTVDRTLTVPVLKATLKNGMIIGSGDIDWADIAQRALPADAIIDADQMLGKTPVRFITVGQPVRLRDVTNPQLVARGDEITILVHSGGMQLTAKGKAMQNGAEGETIRAVNTASNRSLTGTITGDRTITVQ